MPDRTVAILGFHKVGAPPTNGWQSWFYVPEQTFVEFLTILDADNWEIIDLDRFLGALDAPEELPERSALLTFDDGYRSMRHVTPIPAAIKTMARGTCGGGAIG